MKKTRSLVSEIYSNPQYAGHYVITIGGKNYAVKSGKKHAKLLAELIKKYPKETPLITYVPKEDTLILIIS